MACMVSKRAGKILGVRIPQSSADLMDWQLTPQKLLFCMLHADVIQKPAGRLAAESQKLHSHCMIGHTGTEEEFRDFHITT